MMSSADNQGKRHWMVIDGAFDAVKLVEFMQCIVKDVPRKVFLVMDNLKIHHSKPVQEWLRGRHAEIEVFCLPSYSPELNPDERLNAAPRGERNKGFSRRRQHMNMVKSPPERVKTYFKDGHVSYAAESR